MYRTLFEYPDVIIIKDAYENNTCWPVLPFMGDVPEAIQPELFDHNPAGLFVITGDAESIGCGEFPAAVPKPYWEAVHKILQHDARALLTRLDIHDRSPYGTCFSSAEIIPRAAMTAAWTQCPDLDEIWSDYLRIQYGKAAEAVLGEVLKPCHEILVNAFYLEGFCLLRHCTIDKLHWLGQDPRNSFWDAPQIFRHPGERVLDRTAADDIDSYEKLAHQMQSRGVTLEQVQAQHAKAERLQKACRAKLEQAKGLLSAKSWTELHDGFELQLTVFGAVQRLSVALARVCERQRTPTSTPDLDAVFLACDPTFQVDLACRAMAADKHVCTEVPAAFSIEACHSLVDSVQRTGRQYQLMEQTRYWGFVETWADMRRRDELGHVCFAQGEYIHYERGWGAWVNADTGAVCSAFDLPASWNAEPSWRYRILSDPIYYLPHTLSPLLKILDDRVVRVSCMGTRKESYSFPDEETAVPWSDIQYALMHTAKDTVLCVGAGFSLPYVHRGPQVGCYWYEVRGTKASVESPRCRDDAFRVWRPGMATYEPMDLSTIPLNATEEAAKSGHGGADSQASDRFIKAVQTGVPSEMDVYRAVETAAPAILAAESARQDGAMLEVPDFRGSAIAN